MKRRAFITSGAAARPLAASGQHQAMPVIGFLSSGGRHLDDVRRLTPFQQGLNETGYTEGRNVTIEYRGAKNPTAGAGLRSGSPPNIGHRGGR